MISTPYNTTKLESWVTGLLSRGKTGFSLSQLKEHFEDRSDIAIKRSLDRLSKKGLIISIHRGYYIIISPQYASRGMLPPALFIDGLMMYLKRPYYVGLLSAAALHGAAHQQPQEFYVVTTPPALRPTRKETIKINYLTKQSIPEHFIEKKKTESGYINISSAELTALDLLYYKNRVGGLNKIGTILVELVEEFKKERLNNEFVKMNTAASIQRLGFMIETITEKRAFADCIFDTAQKATIPFNRIPLDSDQPSIGFSSMNRWNVVLNTEIDLDQ
jgi:predicted transcriptional regulator of viral defense system